MTARRRDPQQAITAELTMMTPELAATLLDLPKPKGIVPRSIRAQRVDMLAGQIEAGRFLPSGDCVMVCGRLGSPGAWMYNGHHRCLAVVNTGIAVPMVIMQGVPREAMIYQDSGAPRTFADNLQMLGEKQYRQKATVTRLTYHLSIPELATPLTTGGSRQLISFDVLYDWFSANHQVISASLQWGERGHQAFDTSAAAFSTAWMLIYRTAGADGADPVDEFFDRLNAEGPVGTGQSGSQAPMTALRYWLTRKVARLPRGEIKPRPTVQTMMIIKTWNAEQLGVSIVKPLVWHPAELFPDIEFPRIVVEEAS
jgi:hypothetical protein